MFASKGFAGTTMDEVAAAAKLNKATVYHYFASKAELLYTIYVETATTALDMIQALPPDMPPDQALRKVMQANLEITAERPNETAVYFREADWVKEWLPAKLYKEVRAKQDAYFTELLDLLTRGRNDGTFGDVDPDAALQVVVGALSWAARRPASGTADVSTRLADAILNGLLRR